MIDFHSHILPGFDDGAKNPDMSVEMLKKSLADGVDIVVSTSHCYVKSQDSIDAFINRREKYWNILNKNILGHEVPKIIKAAEVNLQMDLAYFSNMEKLTIDNTRYILLELPSSVWDIDVYDYVYNLTTKGFKPILAHIERYLWAKGGFSDLLEMDVLFQVNADLFLTKRGIRTGLELINSGFCHILGSDMHNLSDRPTNIGKAFEVIEKRFGREYIEFFDNNGKNILLDKDIDLDSFTQLPKVKKSSLLF